jgi:hypothetical protein
MPVIWTVSGNFGSASWAAAVGTRKLAIPTKRSIQKHSIGQVG